MVARNQGDVQVAQGGVVARWERYGGLAGIVGALLIGVAVMVQPSTDPGQPAPAVANHLLAHRSGELAGVYLQLAESLATLIFVAALAAVLRRGDERTRLLGSLTLVGGIAAVALVLAAQEMLGTLLTMTLGDGSPEVTRAIYAAFRGVFTASYFFLGVFVFSGGLGMLTSRLLPRWLGWLGLVTGVCHLIGGFSFATWHGPLELSAFVGLLLTLPWMVLTGLWMLRGMVPMRSAAALEGAAEERAGEGAVTRRDAEGPATAGR